MHLFSGSSHRELAEAIAKKLGVKIGAVTLKTFSCGERYVKYEESVRGQDVFIIQTATQNVNEDLIELFLMCQAAKLSFAKSVHVIAPFFPYSRQDRVAEYREPISAKLIAHLLEESGADHVITLNLHSDQIQGFFSIPVDVLEAEAIFAKYIEKKKFKNPLKKYVTKSYALKKNDIIIGILGEREATKSHQVSQSNIPFNKLKIGSIIQIMTRDGLMGVCNSKTNKNKTNNINLTLIQ